MYWTSGRCGRAFECTFKHSQGPTAPAGSDPNVRDDDEGADDAAAADDDDEADSTPDFFSDAGLAAHAGGETALRAMATPVQVHNDIKAFLESNTRLTSPKRMLVLARILANVNSANKSWNPDDAQSFLQMLVQQDGILCIGDILAFKAVRHDSGSNASYLSFQSGYFVILEFLTTDLVLKSTVHKNINKVYEQASTACTVTCDTIVDCVGSMIAAKSWADPKMRSRSISGAALFKTLTTFLLQLFARCTETKTQEKAVHLVESLAAWFAAWSSSVSSVSPTFEDPISSQDQRTKRLVIKHLSEELDRLADIVNREQARKGGRPLISGPSQAARLHRQQARVAQLVVGYEPAGALRSQGSRHDNDFVDISQIEIPPTHDELLSDCPPCLPANLPDAPHHLPAYSMERHIDVQFRLLREELVAPLRNSAAIIAADLKAMATNAKHGRRPQLEHLLKSRGGTYKTSGFDSAFFHIYTGAAFIDATAEKREITVGVRIDTPPTGAARDKVVRKRLEYWANCRRLNPGSLVLLVVPGDEAPRLFLGVVSSSAWDLAGSARANNWQVALRVSFLDPEVELMALRRHTLHDAFLVDNNILYEATRPFLSRLQTTDPADIPFARYLTAGESLAEVEVPPPMYATAPKFRFKLGCLAKPGEQHLVADLDVLQERSSAIARRQLRDHSTLDPSQIDAILHSIMSEVSLIQGPPGTGKSYTGRELIRLLKQSGMRPILLMAQTNHAVDHQVADVVLSGITRRVARLGSQSKNEVVNDFTLEKLEQDADRLFPNWRRALNSTFAEMKGIEEEMILVMRFMQCRRPSWKVMQRHLEKHFGKQVQALLHPPPWIKALVEHLKLDETEHGEWQTKGNRRRDQEVKQYKGTVYGSWREGADLDLLGASGPSATHLLSRLRAPAGLKVPASSRDLDVLKSIRELWSMSLSERKKLAQFWEDHARTTVFDECRERYGKLRLTYQILCAEINDLRDEKRRRILSGMDLIACTTTGAARSTSLLASVAPKVLIVEEAGQVLEAHVLAALVPSVQHVIFIGDPEQLRPNVTNFSLSMEHPTGRELFKFDRSLMERLADESLPMTQINIQRRMRPAISHLIRTILYPALEDHPLVHEYPHVRGMRSDVFFLDHRHPEASPEESVSKFNMHEVAMIKDFVRYLLRQGDYSQPGDIAVLCAYLGQAQKVRSALRDIRVGVAMDERDVEQLALKDMDDTLTTVDVVVTDQIELGTVDIFQGREAKIVIVSLVRNTGTDECESAKIGFLKSSNRIDVTLSRAKYGLFILGNTSNLRKNPTWSTILDEMESHGQIGAGLPIICPRHAEQAYVVSEPGELEEFAPAGGCRLPCLMKMPCGHICPSVVSSNLFSGTTILTLYCQVP
ncbi:NFX1-type zinc finger-containing protein [Phanerochaete sordida]|uniref:NFX1-type zinc finger-containing protein n=1 Tax=Phanerochaete sordida TaxID=48140 RepID=A0A9P3GMH5_9APHY|nr:NFX1-type zinc finger-containing protein [Phanerochaete sordida]